MLVIAMHDTIQHVFDAAVFERIIIVFTTFATVQNALCPHVGEMMRQKRLLTFHILLELTHGHFRRSRQLHHHAETGFIGQRPQHVSRFTKTCGINLAIFCFSILTYFDIHF